MKMMMREVRARYRRGYPWYIVVRGVTDPLYAQMRGWEFVGCQGGLSWSHQFGWE